VIGFGIGLRNNFNRIGALQQLTTTVFDASPALNGDDTNTNSSFRVVCLLSNTTSSQARVTLQPGASGLLTVQHVSIGKWDSSQPTLANTIDTPIEMYCAAASGFAGASTATMTDWTDITSLGLSTGDKVVVIYDIGVRYSSVGGSQKYNNAAVNTTTFYRTSTTSFDLASISGLGYTKLDNINYGIAKIETRDASSYAIGVDIPLAFNDSMFTGMTELTAPLTLANAQNLTRTSIQESSGNPTITSIGNNIVSYCRLISREGVRITDNALSLDHCYLETEGIVADHADSIQAYSPGSRNGVVLINNTHIKAGIIGQNAGMFIADNWGGSVGFKDTIVRGGPYGLRLIADFGVLNLSFENVYFVPPFSALPFSFEVANGGSYVITKWVNVRSASILNGKLIPGDTIPQPV
jgi:hypothetical protein